MLTTAVEARAMFPAVVVVNIPVGINVICPPANDIGDGAVIVAIAVVPETNAICVVGAIVVALAIVGAAAPVASNPVWTIFSFIVMVPPEPDTAEPILIFVADPESPAVPIFIVLVCPDNVAPVNKLSDDELVVEPIEIVVAALKALTVKRFVLNNVSVPVEVEASVGEAPFIFNVVALDKVTVAFAIVAVPVAAPIDKVVAAPKALTPVRFVLNNVSVPVAVDAIVGAAPFMFNAVAFDSVTVALAIVVVPVAAPIAIVVAAPPIFSVVAVALNTAAVVPVVVIAVEVLLFTAIFPVNVVAATFPLIVVVDVPVAEPMLTANVPPAPALPILIVLVFVVCAPVPIFNTD